MTATPPAPRTRRHLFAQDRGCLFPGCPAPVWYCDADHSVPHDQGGCTDPDNCGLLCRRHHRLKTHTGWTWTRHQDGTVAWTSPDGHIWTRPPQRYHHTRHPPAAPDGRQLTRRPTPGHRHHRPTHRPRPHPRRTRHRARPRVRHHGRQSTWSLTDRLEQPPSQWPRAVPPCAPYLAARVSSPCVHRAALRPAASCRAHTALRVLPARVPPARAGLRASAAARVGPAGSRASCVGRLTPAPCVGCGQSLRRRICRTAWSGPFSSTRVARPRVGRMFCARLGPLTSRQMPVAVARASSSDRSA